jgi:hypothetical protein
MHFSDCRPWLEEMLQRVLADNQVKARILKWRGMSIAYDCRLAVFGPLDIKIDIAITERLQVFPQRPLSPTEVQDGATASWCHLQD